MKAFPPGSETAPPKSGYLLNMEEGSCGGECQPSLWREIRSWVWTWGVLPMWYDLKGRKGLTEKSSVCWPTMMLGMLTPVDLGIFCRAYIYINSWTHRKHRYGFLGKTWLLAAELQEWNRGLVNFERQNFERYCQRGQVWMFWGWRRM